MPITVISHDLCRQHDPGPGHPERSERLDAAYEGIARAGMDDELTWVDAPIAAREDLLGVHGGEMVDHIFAIGHNGGGRIDGDTVMSERSLDASLRAAGAGLHAVTEIDQADAVMCLVRPPGHHATPDTSMGFCVFNSAAIAARELTRRGQRVAIVDFDAHHGNGTQDAFYDDPDVLVASLHQWPLYPGTGRHDEIGTGAGEGTTLNIPLPPGATGDVYLRAFEFLVLPALDAHGVDQLMISAGFDSNRADPITDLGLTSADHGRLTAELAAAAGAPIVFLEGGYDLDAVTNGVTSMVTTLGGAADDVEDPTSGGPGRDVVDAIAASRPTP